MNVLLGSPTISELEKVVIQTPPSSMPSSMVALVVIGGAMMVIFLLLQIEWVGFLLAGVGMALMVAGLTMGLNSTEHTVMAYSVKGTVKEHMMYKSSGQPDVLRLQDSGSQFLIADSPNQFVKGDQVELRCTERVDQNQPQKQKSKKPQNQKNKKPQTESPKDYDCSVLNTKLKD